MNNKPPDIICIGYPIVNKFSKYILPGTRECLNNLLDNVVDDTINPIYVLGINYKTDFQFGITGKKKINETYIDATLREITEETNIQVNSNQIIYRKYIEDVKAYSKNNVNIFWSIINLDNKYSISKSSSSDTLADIKTDKIGTLVYGTYDIILRLKDEIESTYDKEKEYLLCTEKTNGIVAFKLNSIESITNGIINR